MRFGLVIAILSSLVACEASGPLNADSLALPGDLPTGPADAESNSEAPSDDVNDDSLATVILSSELLSGLDQDVTTDVLVILDTDRDGRRVAASAVERELPERLGRVLRRFESTPVLSAVVHSREGLEHLRGLPGVRHIVEDTRHEA